MTNKQIGDYKKRGDAPLGVSELMKINHVASVFILISTLSVSHFSDKIKEVRYDFLVVSIM
ncbi:hypothetical protein BOO29_11620 [Vibrio navarrensis]|uniref:Uncharacterized protein n=1 Tax=Vibrio navarrensis TaxID=29495 RepID=A0A099MD85_9VIBR|nr:hypothetical protein EA26_11030 [Vibrio navarrensis]KGK18398.1 hypothetical protein EA25_07925 [Vibrio navarrensis]MBE4585609.1 hypothetical protein [Vibrio navarrensis]MBE4587491.1 hypothetical protein [Vibrio navarrensis]